MTFMFLRHSPILQKSKNVFQGLQSLTVTPRTHQDGLCTSEIRRQMHRQRWPSFGLRHSESFAYGVYDQVHM